MQHCLLINHKALCPSEEKLNHLDPLHWFTYNHIEEEQLVSSIMVHTMWLLSTHKAMFKTNVRAKINCQLLHESYIHTCKSKQIYDQGI